MAPTPRLTEYADAWAKIAADVLDTAYPYATAHMSIGPDDCDVTPHVLHPAFHGSLDWHSSVHMQFSLVTLLSMAGDALRPTTRERAVALLDERLRPDHLATETAYLQAHPHFERPYGWAWALMLGAAATRSPLPQATRWAQSLVPLTELIAELIPSWLSRQVYPVRHGVHPNDAFALSLMHRSLTGLLSTDHADACVDRTVMQRALAAVAQRAMEWFAADTDYDTRIEPSGHDFLSPALTQAECLMQVLPESDRRSWLAGFLPGLGAGAHTHLLTVPEVKDGTDGKLAHLYGLALSRSWQLRSIAPYLPEDAAMAARAGAQAQVEAVLPVITDGDFMATHWLVSFALLGELA